MGRRKKDQSTTEAVAEPQQHPDPTDREVIDAFVSHQGKRGPAAKVLNLTPSTLKSRIETIEAECWLMARNEVIHPDRRAAALSILAELYQGLPVAVEKAAVRKLPRNVDRVAIMSAANLGLISALQDYDPSTNVPFRCFGWTRIKSCIRIEVRSACRRLGHFVQPPLIEPAEDLPPDEPNASSDVTQAFTIDADTFREKSFDRLTQGLEFREKMVLHLYYVESKSTQEIAEAMNVSLTTVRVMRREAIEKLKKAAGISESKE